MNFAIFAGKKILGVDTPVKNELLASLLQRRGYGHPLLGLIWPQGQTGQQYSVENVDGVGSQRI
jgi:hypothetical protein